MKENKDIKESNKNSETKSLNNFITIFHYLLMEHVQFSNCFGLDCMPQMSYLASYF
jgi:hypothetical protein